MELVLSMFNEIKKYMLPLECSIICTNNKLILLFNIGMSVA